MDRSSPRKGQNNENDADDDDESSMSIGKEVEIVSRSINVITTKHGACVEIGSRIVEGRILGGSSPGKGQNKEDDDAEKTGWSGGNEYH